MYDWILTISSDLPASRVGRKAAALGRLAAAGFPVPASFCVTTMAFRAAQANSPHDLRLPDGLLEALTRVLPMEQTLAVRSSAEEEDLPDASLAGRYATFLNVSGPAALEEAILGCWRSAANGGGSGGMAVLIQPLIPAECAGVCFTVDPVRLRPDLLLVVSGWGLGAGVVNGSIPSDTARLRRSDLTVEDTAIADKHSSLQPAPGGGGLVTVSIPDERRAIPCLPKEWLERVGQYGLAIEQVFGTPQDVEWAVAGGQLWILQSRPVTALPVATREAARFPITWADAEEACHFWWMEGGGAPLLPAQSDFAGLSLRGGQEAVYNGGKATTRWLKFVNGRAYMTAVPSPHSAGHVRVYRAALLDLVERLAQQDVTWWEHWGPEIIRATGWLAAFNAHEADGAALADHLEDAVATAQRHWMIHTLVPGRPIRSAPLLECYARMAGRPSGELAKEIPFLLAGAETIQTRLVEALYDLACLALTATEDAKAFALGYPASSKSETPAMQLFADSFRGLIDTYGGRLCYHQVAGFPVKLPLPWREAPEHIWEMVAAYLPLVRRGGPGPRETRLETLGRAQTRVEGLCADALSAGSDPALVEDFRRKLAYARRNAAILDEHNHFIDLLSEGQYVQALLDGGRWLAARGCLPDPFAVFWLHIDEVLAALREPRASLDMLLAERRLQYQQWQALIPPACLGLPDPGLPERPAAPENQAAEGVARTTLPANTLRGEPASRGRAAGRARLIVGDSLPADIAHGDVIVASYAGPVLIPFLPAVSAVVLDQGGPGEHFAITAREFGLPAVCATLQATTQIPEGAWVSVDGDTGLVTWK